MTHTLDDLRARPHLSVSALKMWLACPRKFAKRYVEKAEAAFTPVALPFGRAFHETFGWILLEYQAGRGAPSPAQLDEHFRETLGLELRPDGPPVLFEDDEDEEKLARTGTEMLAAVLDHLPRPDRILHVELPFSLELHDPETGEVLPLPLIGAVDAVVVIGGKVQLWELKSAKRRWSEDQVQFDLQPTAYQRALSSTYPALGLQLLVATKSHKPDVQIERLHRSLEDERDLLVTAASVHRAITAGCFHPIRSWACKGCEYAEHCG